MIRVLTVSDVVEPELYPQFDHDRFQGVDLVLACGDLPPEYLSFLAGMIPAPLYYVRGNHDIRYDNKRPTGCTDIHARLVRFRGLTLLGLSGSHWYNGGPNQYTEGQMRRIIRRLRPAIWFNRGIDLVITHAPPRHIHDAEDPCHRGFECYRWLIQKYAPAYFVHGHIHCQFTDPGERISVINHTRVINSYGHYRFEIDAGPSSTEVRPG